MTGESRETQHSDSKTSNTVIYRPSRPGNSSRRNIFHTTNAVIIGHPMVPESASRYTFGFMAASLRPDLARIVAEAYLKTGNWDIAKEEILATNALQFSRPATAIRMERELRQRLSTLEKPQLELLVAATAEDRDALTWLATVKHIPLAFALAADVLREKLAHHDPILRRSDYATFEEQQSLLHPELGQLSASSRRKVRQILLRMLAEAGILKTGVELGTIQRPVISPLVSRAITTEGPRWFPAFLVPDEEIAVQ